MICTKDTKIYNDTCEVSCELGYNLTSSDGVHKCTENGTWSNNVTCERTLHQPYIYIYIYNIYIYIYIYCIMHSKYM